MQDIYEVLDSLGLDYQKHEHHAVFTCEDSDGLFEEIEGGHIKNLFLRNKNGNQHYLVVVESSKTVDLKELRKYLGESKISFGSAERLMENLGVTPGSVSPLALINNEKKDIVVILDEGLLKYDILNCHPNINTATLGLKREDLLKFLDYCGHELRMIEL